MYEKVITVRNYMSRWKQRLEEAGVPDARISVEWILQQATGWSRTDVLMRMDAVVPSQTRTRLDAMLERRLSREPLQYIVGVMEFYGLSFRVTPDVLIPRPETELLVDEARHAIRTIGHGRVLDIGTGSGCIPLAIKHHVPAADVAACDVSEQALVVARDNARRLGLDVAFFQADVFDPTFANQIDPVDVLVSNPPYVPDSEAAELEPEVVAHEPHLALFAGDDPLRFYRRIAELAPRLLTTDGVVLLEVHIDHAAAVGKLLSNVGLRDVRVIDDLTGRPRVVAARAAQP